MRYFFVIFFIMLFTNARASHIVGGDIYYDYLGGNSYRFYINLYRDCLSTGAQYDDPLYLAVHTASGGLVQNISVPFPGSTNLPVIFNNPCVIPPSNICTELASYTVVINLPPTVGGYNITYQRCCRGPNITNLAQPDDTGISLTCHVPGINTGATANSSPRFTNYPPLLLCNNEDLYFDHSALDPDGDQLVYSLVTPSGGASSFNPQPNPAPAPPHPPVNWNGPGFSAAQALGPGATINIDPNTGVLTASPGMLGLFVVGIEVQEIRNGVVLNRTVRDFIFRVFNCAFQMESILPAQEDLASFVSYCSGLTVQFENDSYGGTNYAWDFGVPGITTDVSTSFAPSYTYPAAGNYTAMLVVNPGWPCTDTAYMDIIVNNEFEVSWTSQDSLCIFGNSFDFVAVSTGPPNMDYQWDFGPNANPTSGTGQTVNNVNFNTTGQISVTITGSIPDCQSSYTDEIYIYPEPVAEIILPVDIECLGLDIDFQSSTVNANDYDWDFGVAGINSDVSELENPSYTFPGPGVYTVTLIAGSTSSCRDTTEQTFTLNEPLIISFSSEDEMCITDNSFNFDGTVSGPPNSVYTWNFGPNANPQNSTDIDVNNVVFNTTGTQSITLTGAHDNCVESVTQEVYLYTPPSINFELEPGLQCVPFNAQFLDLSWSETPIFYNWEFGDGATSSEQNPEHLYTEEGPFPVSLTIHTTQGCIDTLTLLQSDLVHVRPNPTAGFSLTPEVTDICDSEIQFIDESIGGHTYFYWFDDTTSFSEGENAEPNYQYLYDGTHYPTQIVTNEWGCKDTAMGKVTIEPFTLFLPNTFTPDGDEFNNIFEAHSWLYIYEWEFKIYNRWGELLWESHDVSQGWDGTGPNGRMVQDGTYGYTIRYRTCEPLKPDKFITGHVNMLR